jgi:hypothetical protein
MIHTLGYVLHVILKDGFELALLGLAIYGIYCIGEVNGWSSGG